MTVIGPRILLTGSHGFVGVHLASALRADGADVVALDRVARPGVGTLAVDIRRPDLETILPEAVDIVVHAAAALPSHSADEIFATDVQATLRLMSWARRAGVRHFIHLSSTAVYGPGHPPDVTEDQPLRSWDAYNSAKIRAEGLFPPVFSGSGTAWTILRPKAIVGQGRLGLFGQLFDFAASGKRFPLIGSGKAVYQFLHVDDLVQAVRLVIRRPDAASAGTFNIASRADHSVAELFQSVLNVAGYGKRVLRVPEPLARSVLHVAFLAGVSPVYSRLVHNLTQGSTVSLAAADRALGFTPRHDGMTALLETFDWYRNRPATAQSAGSGQSHREVWRNPLAAFVKALI
jgi:nucleoside-diphosphate-sugar epimerase